MWIMLAAGLLTCGLVVADGASTSAIELPDHAHYEHMMVPGNGRVCLVCSQSIDGQAALILYKGRRIYLHADACLASWRQDADTYFTAMQALGALFDENSVNTGEVTLLWLYFGFYMLAGLIFGALCAYMALNRGHPPLEWFFLGLAFNAFALVGLTMKRQGDLSTLPEGVPAGLRKVPVTSSPVACPGCGAANHPTANACLGCGVTLQPAYTSEANGVR